MDESLEIGEIIQGELFSGFEKSREVGQAVRVIDRALAEETSPRILLKGGPGVGKSTTSYELLEFLQKERGYDSLWVQPEELGRSSFRDKLESLEESKIIFIDSIDVVLSDPYLSEELVEVVEILNEMAQNGRGPLLIANIHDPYLVKKGMELHDKAREFLLGDDGIFQDVSQHIQVEDQFADRRARDRALEKAMEESDIDKSWMRFLSDQLDKNNVNQHSELSNLFSKFLLESENFELPLALSSPYNREGEEIIAQWMNGWIPRVRAHNEKFNRAYYHPDSEEEIWKGLVSIDVTPVQGNIDEPVKPSSKVDDLEDFQEEDPTRNNPRSNFIKRLLSTRINK